MQIAIASRRRVFLLPLQLKVDHSQRVAGNARRLAEDLG